MLEARGLSLRRGRRRVFDGLDLRLEPGITALLGPNGAGKTTLLEAFANPRRIAAGELTVDGSVVTGSRETITRYLASSGFMPQHWQFFRGFTALESVEYVAWLKQVPRADLRAAAVRALGAVGLEDHLHERVSSFSGGMRQRVGLAEALVNTPAVVYLDEPTVGLDPEQRSTFRAALRREGNDRVTLLSTHLTDDVAAIADRVVVIAHGRRLFDGSPAELAEQARDSDGDEMSSKLEQGYLRVLEHDRRGAA